MDKWIRKTLDLVQMPINLIVIVFMDNKQREIAYQEMQDFRCEWRAKTLSFKIVKSFLHRLLPSPPKQ